MPSELGLESAMRKQRWIFITQAVLRLREKFYIADFLVKLKGSRQLVIEIDGPSHNNKRFYDMQRDNWIHQHFGHYILHITAKEAVFELPKVMGVIQSFFPAKYPHTS